MAKPPEDFDQGVLVRPAAGKGWGVFARRRFGRLEFILPVRGAIVARQTEYSYQIGFGRHVEPIGPARYINHSCEPNAGLLTLPDGLYDVVAMRAIEPGEEVTLDYGLCEFAHEPRTDPRDEFDLTCRCGVPSCRGRFGYYAEFTPELKKKYEGFIAGYLVRYEHERRRR